MRGRKANPRRQAVKGNPGKRLSAKEKAAILREEGEAARAAALADLAASSDDPTAPPLFFAAQASPAMQVWRDLAPRLTRLNLLQEADRLTFAMFCVSYDAWAKATAQLRTAGEVVSVKTIAGGNMLRRNPWVDIQAQAFGQCMTLSERFGLTPLDRAKLFRDRAALPPGAWSGTGESAGKAEQLDLPGAAPASPSSSGVGAMDDLDTPPPRLM